MKFLIHRTVFLFPLLALSLSPGGGWAASSPGGGQTEPTQKGNTAGIIAVGAMGVVIVGGLLWWRFHQASSSEEWGDVTVRKPQGSAPVLIVAEFQDQGFAAEKTHLSRKVRSLVWDALKHSQAYVLQDIPDIPAGATGDSAMVLTAKVSSLANFSQAEVAVSRKGGSLFGQTLTWFDERELRTQIVQLANRITEKVK